MNRTLSQSSRWLGSKYARSWSPARMAAEFQQRWTHSSKRRKRDTAAIPLIGQRVHIPFESIENSTITPRERDVFQRLFQDVIKDANKSTPGMAEKPMKTAVGRRRRNIKTREELLESVAKFPEALREIALSSAEKMEDLAWEEARNAERERQKAISAPPLQEVWRTEELKRAQEQALAHLQTQFDAAKTDFELWKIIEEELFNKVEAIQLDEVVQKYEARVNKNGGRYAGRGSDDAPLAKEAVRDFTSIGLFYPAGLLAAFRAFRRRFPTSTLPVCILPRVKRLGRGSYALGASTALYHELLDACWALTGDHLQIITILEEMDMAGFDFDDETFLIVKRIHKQWQTRVRKPRSRLEAQVVRMGTVNEGFDKVLEWKTIIEERLEAEALRQANQKLSEHIN